MSLLKTERPRRPVPTPFPMHFRPQTVFFWLSAATLVACRSKETGTAMPPKVAASAQSADLKVVPDAAIEQGVNPGREKPYSGPVGHVAGLVHAIGDSAPSDPDIVAKIPPGTCNDARAFYGKRFREGPHRELGDVLVAVTGYKGYVPAEGAFKSVTIRGCAFESRTVVLTFGQSIHVFNKSGETFIPELRGARSAALMVAVPGGDAVALFPDHVGQFELVDRSRQFARADVFVLKYPTVAVTGLDGKFSISGIPVGDVIVSALLPATGQTAQKNVSVVSGETATVDFELPFTANEKAAPSPSAH